MSYDMIKLNTSEQICWVILKIQVKYKRKLQVYVS